LGSKQKQAYTKI